MQLDVIGFRGDGGDSTLGIIRVRVSAIFFGDDCHPVVLSSHFQGKVKAGDAAADHDNIIASCHARNDERILSYVTTLLNSVFWAKYKCEKMLQEWENRG